MFTFGACIVGGFVALQKSGLWGYIFPGEDLEGFLWMILWYLVPGFILAEILVVNLVRERKAKATEGQEIL